MVKIDKKREKEINMAFTGVLECWDVKVRVYLGETTRLTVFPKTPKSVTMHPPFSDHNYSAPDTSTET